MPLRLHAVTPNNDLPAHGEPLADGISIVPYRELGAVVSATDEFRADVMGPDTVSRHRDAVDAAFRRGPVLPAPLGVVFRNADVLVRWMELHYVVLHEALGYFDDRVGARVHAISAREGGAPDAQQREAADGAASAQDAFHALRRAAVISVPLDRNAAGAIASAAFLVETGRWNEFEQAVGEQGDARPDLRFDLSGPWPPYDFVRMRFQTADEK